MSGLTLEAIISEDIPVIETSIREAVERLPSLAAIVVENEVGKLIAQWPKTLFMKPADQAEYTQDVVFEEEIFGHMKMRWSTRGNQLMIDESVGQARLYASGVLIFLSALFYILISNTVLKPLEMLHQRLLGTAQHSEREKVKLSKRAALEFHALAKSVDALGNVLRQQKRREIELEEAHRASEAASRSKSEFLANMSHEIRTPMNGVIGMAELLLESALTRDQQCYAETISKSGSALLIIINDILDFSKIEAGKLQLDPVPFDLRKAIEDVVVLMSSRAHQKDVELTLRYAPGIPIGFNGDVGRIRQIVTNLVGNAVKFTPSGFVSIDVDGIIQDGRASLKISVTDTGIGIPAENIASIFSEFEQVDGASNRKFEGTGLGLAISSRLVELMHGNITVESQPGKGSTFAITLNLAVDDAVTETIAMIDVDLRGKRVLIVDDLPVNRTILTERLANWDIITEAVESGVDALLALERAANENQPFDLAILDYQMPNMDGRKLGELIKQNDTLCEIPLILLSSVDQSNEIRQLRQIGFADVLLKPVRASMLFNTLGEAFQPQALQQLEANRMAPEKAEPATGPKANATRILVAEDNKTNQLVLKSMLKPANVELCFANDGVEAVEMLTDFDPDMIFMDISMPNMDGLEATQVIRIFEEGHSLARCPIVALTANAMRGDRERCLAAGMDDYLVKPIVKVRLLQMIEDWGTQKEKEQGAPMIQNELLEQRQRAGSVNGRVVENMLDVVRLQEMFDDFGEEIFLEIVMEFYKDVEEALRALSNAASINDTEEVKKVLHLIRGCASNLGITTLVDLCHKMKRELEMDAGDGMLDIAPFDAAFKDIRRQLEALDLAA
jgi:signal transduction histidine kinase/DNA-binding response OmpR family regulator/HPt (histidine-containing phosphotransfer) domain-containing protein